MKVRIAVTAVTLALAGCTGSSSNGSTAALEASAQAKLVGAASYVITDGAVEVRDTSGRSLALLTVEETGELARTVHFTRSDDGATYDNEITGKKLPIIDVPVEQDLLGLVESDPALKSFFSQHQLAFIVNGSEGPHGAVTREAVRRLKSQYWVNFCNTITFVSQCTKWWSCPTDTDTNVAYAMSVGNLYENSQCDQACFPYLALNPTEWNGWCDCYSGTESTYDLAACPPSGHGCTNSDVVKKAGTCSVPSGSCSFNAAPPNGFQYCI